VITRNSYGALCLNTPNAFFVDIDFDDPRPDAALKRKVRMPLLALAALAGVVAKSWMVGIASAIVVLVLPARVNVNTPWSEVPTVAIASVALTVTVGRPFSANRSTRPVARRPSGHCASTEGGSARNC
jgi:hypothetical protein